MQNYSNSFKHAMLKQMLLGFQLSEVSSHKMSLQERKTSIKISADVAMAIARGNNRKWTQGVIANLSKDERNKYYLKCMLGGQYVNNESIAKPYHYSYCSMSRSKKILRRSFIARRLKKEKNESEENYYYCHDHSRSCSSSILARVLVKRRMKLLRKIVPGGELLNGLCLLDETLDYVVALKAQADLMHSLVQVVEASNIKYRSVQGKHNMQEKKVSSVGK